MTLGPIINGKDFNFFRKVTVTSATFSTLADVVINIDGQQSFSLINEGTGIIEYSFNGNTLHGDMTPLVSESLMFYGRRISKIWFRVKSGSASIIRVEAWAAI